MGGWGNRDRDRDEKNRTGGRRERKKGKREKRQAREVTDGDMIMINYRYLGYYSGWKKMMREMM